MIRTIEWTAEGVVMLDQTKLPLATGFYDIPYLINVKGEDLPKVTHYFKEPHPYIGQKVVALILRP